MGRTLFLLAAVCAMAFAGPSRAEEPVPIGDVAADPDAYHFRLVALQGTVRRIALLPPYTPRPDTTCYGAYTFVLEDATGSIEVSVLGICGQPVLRKPEVEDGETIVLLAQILSPNRLTSAPKGEAKPLRAVANEIRHLSRVQPLPEPAAPVRADEPATPEASEQPSADSGY